MNVKCQGIEFAEEIVKKPKKKKKKKNRVKKAGMETLNRDVWLIQRKKKKKIRAKLNYLIA